MMAVIIKNNPQSPPSPSTIAPDEDANNVLPAVPTEASKAYCVAVKLRSTRSDINVTNATVAKAAARSSMITANANRTLEGPTHAKTENRMVGADIAMPGSMRGLTIPDLIAIAPPIRVKTMVVIQPSAFE